MESQVQNTVLSIGMAVVGTFSPIVNEVANLRVPPLLMDIFQLLSYSAGVVIAIVTVLKWLKHRKL